MSFSSTLAAHRFGYGLSPEIASPKSVNAMLRALRGRDRAATQFALPPVSDVHALTAEFRRLQKVRRKALRAGRDDGPEQAAFDAFKKTSRPEISLWTVQGVLRRVWSEDGLRERLVDFWTDHFAARGKNYDFRTNEAHYAETAIRPYVSGKFADLLEAAVLHPMMLHFLDQNASVGPDSLFARRRPKQSRGLNENLAREILELHTLGVGGAYEQKDVRQLAKLLTGVRAEHDIELRFEPRRAEPGAETVLGRSYGGTERAELEDVQAVLRDLAVHPDTAGHLARKMAVHFVADAPDAEMVASMKAAFVNTDGDLSAMTEAMLRHPAAWQAARRNFKQPMTFLCSALRGLAVPVARMNALQGAGLQRYVGAPLRAMGQPLGKPLGPDGFSEADGHWLSPQGLAARLQWSLSAPVDLARPLPDPRRFVLDVLGEDVPKEVLFAAKAAESRREGVALVLMSPAFQRM
ncbi:hypothetical protein shim_14860 [Shimia sp. SK013]|uniref:DUF1800 domain-containing protein n=1 Tax=Shimia sp. SK013 TaxID=1389006 RepID=UPI0006B58672|nr:DUF1800 domain-containing protein [Shimia sp. SK013]KPA23191.1 hypothetical protein shim_14860 [Shimia sp. SK013]